MELEDSAKLTPKMRLWAHYNYNLNLDYKIKSPGAGWKHRQEATLAGGMPGRRCNRLQI